MALWDNKQGIRVYNTEDKTANFVEVETKWIPFMAPFMALPQINGQWSQEWYEEKKGEYGGWVVKTDKFPDINLFLEAFANIFTLPDDTLSVYESTEAKIKAAQEGKEEKKEKKVELQRDELELPPRDPKHASFYRVTKEELILLSLLFEKKDIETRKEAAEDIEWSILTKSLDMIYRIFNMSSDTEEFKGMLTIYLRNKVLGVGLTLEVGDVLRIDYLWLDGTNKEHVKFDYIYDGNKFINTAVNMEYQNIVPRQFTCPPFPVGYWYHFEDIDAYRSFEAPQVWPNFAYPDMKIEYNNNPIAPENEDYNEQGEYVSLDCYIDTMSFRVYFFAPKKLSYDDVVKFMNQENMIFIAADENNIFTQAIALDDVEGVEEQRRGEYGHPDVENDEEDEDRDREGDRQWEEDLRQAAADADARQEYAQRLREEAVPEEEEEEEEEEIRQANRAWAEDRWRVAEAEARQESAERQWEEDEASL